MYTTSGFIIVHTQFWHYLKRLSIDNTITELINACQRNWNLDCTQHKSNYYCIYIRSFGT